MISTPFAKRVHERVMIDYIPTVFGSHGTS